MKRSLFLVLAVLLVLFCAVGCASKQAEAPAGPQSAEVQTEPEETLPEPAEEPVAGISASCII